MSECGHGCDEFFGSIVMKLWTQVLYAQNLGTFKNVKTCFQPFQNGSYFEYSNNDNFRTAYNF